MYDLKHLNDLDSKVAEGRKPSGFAAPDGLRRSAKSVTYLRTSPNGVIVDLWESAR